MWRRCPELRVTWVGGESGTKFNDWLLDRAPPGSGRGRAGTLLGRVQVDPFMKLEPMETELGTRVLFLTHGGSVKVTHTDNGLVRIT